MAAFAYSSGQLCAGQVSLADVASRFGTPCYVYSRQEIESRWCELNDAFAPVNHLICYAVKANSNIAVLNILARLGSGFDIVSGGELERVIRAGGDPGKVVFSGVGKRSDEIRFALEQEICTFNIESVAEMERLNKIAGTMNCIAPVSLRVNPDVDVNTHPYIATGLRENKFGIPYDEALDNYRHASSLEHIRITGIDCHIGSQITSIEPFVDALKRLLLLVTTLESEGITLSHIDIGGGLGIRYSDETPPAAKEYANAILSALKGNKTLKVLLEPGRSIMGDAGILLTRVEYVKKTPGKNFAIVDAAMNDLLRPALYDAWHTILPVNQQQEESGESFDIVGPVCESGDFLGKNRAISIQEGDLLAICSAGAYGYSMSSNYNTRPRACEIMVDDNRVFEINARETVSDLFAGEKLLPG